MARAGRYQSKGRRARIANFNPVRAKSNADGFCDFVSRQRKEIAPGLRVARLFWGVRYVITRSNLVCDGWQLHDVYWQRSRPELDFGGLFL